MPACVLLYDRLTCLLRERSREQTRRDHIIVSVLAAMPRTCVSDLAVCMPVCFTALFSVSQGFVHSLLFDFGLLYHKAAPLGRECAAASPAQHMLAQEGRCPLSAFKEYMCLPTRT
eukprot:scaffold169082_cov18-Tisochrysis_lutea.AAC.1